MWSHDVLRISSRSELETFGLALLSLISLQYRKCLWACRYSSEPKRTGIPYEHYVAYIHYKEHPTLGIRWDTVVQPVATESYASDLGGRQELF